MVVLPRIPEPPPQAFPISPTPGPSHSPQVIPILPVGARRTSGSGASPMMTSPNSLNLTAASDRILSNLVRTLAELKLEMLSKEWVDNVWDSQFTECNMIEVDPENADGETADFYIERAHRIASNLDKVSSNIKFKYAN